MTVNQIIALLGLLAFVALVAYKTRQEHRRREAERDHEWWD